MASFRVAPGFFAGDTLGSIYSYKAYIFARTLIVDGYGVSVDDLYNGYRFGGAAFHGTRRQKRRERRKHREK
jgi:hypothetical protein